MASLRAQAFDKQYAKTGQVSFKKSGRSAAYRGTATKALRGGSSSASAHRAGMKAEQAYAG